MRFLLYVVGGYRASPGSHQRMHRVRSSYGKGLSGHVQDTRLLRQLGSVRMVHHVKGLDVALDACSACRARVCFGVVCLVADW
jgi:hypothetical protein